MCWLRASVSVTGPGEVALRDSSQKIQPKGREMAAKPPSNCQNHPQYLAIFLSLDCWSQQSMTQLSDGESTAGSERKSSHIAIISLCISCWLSGLLPTAASPFLELTTVLF